VCGWQVGLHYIRNYSGLSKSIYRDHYADAAKEQCLDMFAEINVFSFTDEML